MVQKYVLILEATFWNKNYIQEISLKNVSVKAVIKYRISIWQGTKVIR